MFAFRAPPRGLCLPQPLGVPGVADGRHSSVFAPPRSSCHVACPGSVGQGDFAWPSLPRPWPARRRQGLENLHTGCDLKVQVRTKRIRKELRRSISASSPPPPPKSHCVLKKLLSQRQGRLRLVWGKRSDQCLLSPISCLSIPRQTSAEELGV